MLKSPIPSAQRAVVVKKMGKDWKVEVDSSYAVPDLQPGQALVRLSYTGVCHSDLSLINGGWNRRMMCDVPGHEGVGEIVAYHHGTDPATVPPLGSKVGVPLIRRPCRTCVPCKLVDGEVLCPNSGFNGLESNGTYQQYISVFTSYLVLLPDAPTIGDALFAPVLCGGVTAYKALKKCGAGKGDWVAIAGAGGGLGSFAVQYAVAMGMRVIGIDTGEGKKEATVRLGATAFVDYRVEDDVPKSVNDITGGTGVQAAIVLAPSEVTYNQALQYVGYQGCIVCVGLPHEDVRMAVPPGLIIHRDICIRGSMVGTRKDIGEALDYVVRGLVKPDVVVHSVQDIVQIYQKMEKNNVVGRTVLDLRREE
ncbi:hypothetical protein B0J13DRAFT_541160 [Dactylonectria estremocensis]|uniref:Enoyl reductase (ER) domain-containing protein n=1 Tax=Dactylonectria estremocensis TaxID=1079267 RepID=A0A9P9JIS5_9HYPO|nr:hypothetical protein B0J13DRAFT_541160 [Dactylonectria estremocensis]